MKKFKQRPIWQAVVIGLVISTAITLVFDYLLPTPWNFRSEGTWVKLFFVVLIYCFIKRIKKRFLYFCGNILTNLILFL